MTDNADFVGVYRRWRVTDQRHYYTDRVREFDSAQRQVSVVSATLLVLGAGSSFAAGVSMGPRAQWAVLATVLPALAGMVQAYSRLMAYGRLAKLYQDASNALGAVGAEPRVENRPPDEVRKAVNVYVAKVERIFRKEQGQWGQLVAELELERPPPRN